MMIDRVITTRFLQVFLTGIFAWLVLASAAYSASVNTNRNGVAINGYDAVAYFTRNAAIKGSSSFSTRHKGAKYYFSSDANRAAFKSNPSKYAPQYGGFCAYAVSKGSTASVEVDKFTIVRGKLYLNYNGTVLSIWRQDKAGNISKANKNWPGISRR